MADGPEEYRRLTREMIREGVDIIKLVISGDSFVPHAGSETTVMSEAEVAAAEVAHAHGKRLSVHARSAESVKLCGRHGIKVIYHANYADEEALDLLEANKDWLFISPNIGFTAIAAYEGGRLVHRGAGSSDGVPGGNRQRRRRHSGIDETRRPHPRRWRLRFHDHSARPKCPRSRPLHQALRHAPDGVDPHDDKNGGEAMDMPDRLGQIREGLLAELLLVDGNPLADTKLLLRRENLRLIMKDGKLHKHLNRK